MKKPTTLVVLLVCLFSTYQIGSAIYLSQKTGTLIVDASDAKATITLTQANHQLLDIGVGKAKVRLQPGSYKVIATDGKFQSTKDTQIYKKITTTANVTLNIQQQNQQAAYNVEANNLISRYLPFTERHNEYRVSYLYQVNGDVAKPTIVITSSSAKGREDAIKWIQGLGFNPSHLQIQYAGGD
jgi:hypothetical protein